tara:strand:+ start:29926 stop:30120 length:195 start_codon:yes stop_codon:yes gene_type:complete
MNASSNPKLAVIPLFELSAANEGFKKNPQAIGLRDCRGWSDPLVGPCTKPSGRPSFGDPGIPKV